jgi:hypothetical protein
MDTTLHSISDNRKRLGRLACAAMATVLMAASAPVAAVDGCLVLLCFAAPNWRAIAQCVPPIRDVLRCRRRFKSEPPRRSNIEPGVEADFDIVGCG